VPSQLADGVPARGHRATDALHSMIYFVPEADEYLTATGLRPGRMGYFASRSAPMGPVTPAVTVATFYNFNPELVNRFLPRAWTLAAPDAVIAARFTAADHALRRLLGEDIIASPELAELAELTRVATAGLEPAGRALYAAHAQLDWPQEPHLALWHGITLMREFRGDGHLAALLDAQLNGVEALVTHTATGKGFTVQAAKATRGWSDEQWAATEAGLRERGQVDDHGLTPAGAALREQVETATDRMDSAPYLALGEPRTARLIELGKRFSRVAVANGAFRTDALAQRS
jgi:hypothetical protein